jgi:hypothetical protein
LSAAEIHRKLCAVYGQNIVSEGTARQWCRMFKDGRTNVHDEKRSGRPSVLSDDLARSVDQKICDRRCFTVSELSYEFPQIAHTILCENITVRLGCHKFCARWVQNISTGAHKTQRMTSVLASYNDTTKVAMNFSITSYE